MKNENKNIDDLDPRRCEKCGEMMENKGGVCIVMQDRQPHLYQCPKCKNVEILWL
jgi:NAD-dependent SIR2 family protein deacetylase